MGTVFGVTVSAQYNTYGSSAGYMPSLPPAEAERDIRAEMLGLAEGLKYKTKEECGGRTVKCGCCGTQAKSWVFIPWTITNEKGKLKSGKIETDVTEACRIDYHKNNITFWCLDCAIKLTNKARGIRAPIDIDAVTVLIICGVPMLLTLGAVLIKMFHV